MNNSTSCLTELWWDFFKHSLQINGGKGNEVLCNLRLLGWARENILPDLRVFFRAVAIFMINRSCRKQALRVYICASKSIIIPQTNRHRNLKIRAAWSFLETTKLQHPFQKRKQYIFCYLLRAKILCQMKLHFCAACQPERIELICLSAAKAQVFQFLSKSELWHSSFIWPQVTSIDAPPAFLSIFLK